MLRRITTAAIVLATFLCIVPIGFAQTLEDELKQLAPGELAKLAKSQGDPARGAVAFLQRQMSCAKCHTLENGASAMLGPDLSALGKDVTDEALIESLLYPSKTIRKGFESVTVTSVDGKTTTGILVERTKTQVVLRELANAGAPTTFKAEDIDDVTINTTSIMPEGQINQLENRGRFFDLVRYLAEIRDGGPARARELKPADALLAVVIPEYEYHLDHAGLISAWDDAAFKRGQAIYQRVCANCHGTREAAGSLPNSLRFAEGKFKNGSDPLAMYRTLTHGFGMMTPQTWMVPSQKYDVVHYIREAYLKPFNPTQLTTVDAAYLGKLPRGDTRGPEPSKIVPWSAMDYGPSLTHAFEIPGAARNLAYKGTAVRLDSGAGGISRGTHWMMFDHDTMRAAVAWNAVDGAAEHFIDWQGIQFNGAHGVHPRVVGRPAFVNSTGPGWANPATGEFIDDQRVLGRDGNRYGPLPNDWAKFKGQYYHGERVVYAYRIGRTEVLESPGMHRFDEKNQGALVLRTLNLGARDRRMILQVAEFAADNTTRLLLGENEQTIVLTGSPKQGKRNAKTALESIAGTLIAGHTASGSGLSWSFEENRLCLVIPPGEEPLRLSVWMPADASKMSHADALAYARKVTETPPANPAADLAKFTHGGPPRWPQTLETRAVLGTETGPFAADVLTAPDANPWLALMRFTGLDFFADGRIAVCTWDGDVWLVEPGPFPSNRETEKSQTLRWRRIATGMYQPLGLKIVSGKIHVICRDQLTVLHDLNGDQEIDYYECLNNDHQVTEHFHEFAMGLQTDAEGNFYYAKSGRHGLPAVVPHHGTLLKIAKDGSRTDILATGFRAANGVCLNPDGSFVVTDQEGFWNPKNRINWVTLKPHGKPNFYGNMWGYHDVTDESDAAMVPPLCWITNIMDRSPAELLWVESDRWGPLKGSLLNLSYGTGKVFLVPHENIGGTIQGGVIELPIPAFPTGVMRGRFHPTDGQLYLCGMFAWAGNATAPGGLYRLRATGHPIHLPVGLHARKGEIELVFSEPLDPKSIAKSDFQIKTWSLQRTAKYGSKHFDEKAGEIQAAKLSPNGLKLSLAISELSPTWGMEIRYSLKTAAGNPIQGVIHNTIHQLGE